MIPKKINMVIKPVNRTPITVAKRYLKKSFILIKVFVVSNLNRSL
jgi:hypothetical protein